MQEYFSVPLWTSHLLRARNYEFEVACSSVKRELENYEFEDPYLIMCIQNFERHMDDVEKLASVDMAHSASPAIVAYIKESHVALSAIARAVDAFGRLEHGSDREHAIVLYNWIRKTRRNMLSNLQLRQLEAVAVLRQTAREDEAVPEALQALGLMKLFEKVLQIHNSLDVLLGERIGDLAELKELREGFREQVVFDIQLLMDALLGAANVKGEMQRDYQTICRRLGRYFTFSSAIIKARDTRYANKRLEEGEMPDSGDDDADDSEDFSDDDFGNDSDKNHRQPIEGAADDMPF